MAGGGDQRLRYVKLTTDELQGPFEEIRPGELNQPIDVPIVPKCDHCRQPLPENFTPLDDEPGQPGSLVVPKILIVAGQDSSAREHREMKVRLSDGVVAPSTAVDPPPVQEMINGTAAGDEDSGTTPSPGTSVGRNNWELQAL
ncbi:hypothetical protein RHGRI_011946 [Rhododendron griersonianum]|uniref:Uncharacterized protein n=1 Tax=Rhododendron griersonianum TaxID=479676 RepID=A0AAV6KP87_9ERIC|nr:hypothetical protein RHGRI_011946 [Rhododendron griersonianum]